MSRLRSAIMPARRAWLAALLLASSAAAVAQTSLTISPQQVYVSECQEGFVTLTGTNLTGTVSTLVDFSGNSQIYELQPSTATSTQLVVWIPMGVALATGAYSVTVNATDTGGGMRTIGPATFNVVARSGALRRSSPIRRSSLRMQDHRRVRTSPSTLVRRVATTRRAHSFRSGRRP